MFALSKNRLMAEWRRVCGSWPTKNIIKLFGSFFFDGFISVCVAFIYQRNNAVVIRTALVVSRHCSFHVDLVIIAT